MTRKSLIYGTEKMYLAGMRQRGDIFVNLNPRPTHLIALSHTYLSDPGAASDSRDGTHYEYPL